jgi:hypothetical protein
MFSPARIASVRTREVIPFQEAVVDSRQFDALISRLDTHLNRRRSLSLLGVAGVAGLWRVGDAEAKKRKKRPRKCFLVRYAVCFRGETVTVNSCGRDKLLKRGAQPGACPTPCVPQCTDCTGSDDGCGGTCSCPEGQVCIAAACQDPQ